jgi:hypothetical protein
LLDLFDAVFRQAERERGDVALGCRHQLHRRLRALEHLGVIVADVHALGLWPGRDHGAGLAQLPVRIAVQEAELEQRVDRALDL